MMMPWHRRAERLREDAVLRLAQQISDIRAEIRGHVVQGNRLATAELARIEAELADNARAIAAGPAEVATEHAAWEPGRWTGYSPQSGRALCDVRVGSLIDTASGIDLHLPMTVPFGDDRVGPVVLAGHTDEELAEAAGLLHSITLRMVTSFPGQLRVVLLDPVKRGGTFSYAGKLDRPLLGFDDVKPVLAEVIGDIDRIEAHVLRHDGDRLSELPATARLAERHQLLVVPDFPSAYQLDEIDIIVEIARRGPRCGVVSLIQLTDDPEGFGFDSLEPTGPTVLEIGEDDEELSELGVRLAYDQPPTWAIRQQLLRRLAALVVRDTPIDWSSIAPPAAVRWSPATPETIAATVGLGAAAEDGVVAFGDPNDDRSGNAIVVGGTETSRRQLYDGLLAGLGSRYSPTELTVELIQLGSQPMFDGWSRLPHLTLFARQATIVQLRSALEQTIAEISRREDERAGTSPRRVVMIDGVESLLGAAATEFAGSIEPALRRGPAVGVHLVVGSTRHDRLPLEESALDHLHLRIGLTPAGDDAVAGDLFGVDGTALLVAAVDRPTRALLRQRIGRTDRSAPIQLAELDSPAREALLHELNERAGTLDHRPRLRTINGTDAPQVGDDPRLARMIDEEAWGDAATLAEVARSIEPDSTWSPDEQARLIVVGEPDDLAGRSHFALRRRPTENVVAVLARREQRVGVLTGILVSAVLCDHPTTLEVWLADRGPSDDPVTRGFDATLRQLASLGVRVSATRKPAEAASFIEQLSAEVLRRHELTEEEVATLPTALLVLAEPDRLRALHRTATTPGSIDSPLGLELRYVLMQGPSVGVHVVLTTSTPAALRSVLTDAVVHRDFRHRLVSALSEEDSFAFVRSGKAAGLPKRGPTATRAVLFDGDDQSSATMRPYSAGTTETTQTERVDVVALLERLGDLLDG